MAKKLPYYHRYPGDYAVLNVAFVSLAAQGLWLRMEDLMHASERYGYLQIDGKAMPDAMIARRCGIDLPTYVSTLEELEAGRCISREQYTHVIFSPNLLKQDEKRAGDRARDEKRRKPSSNLAPTSPEPRSNFSETFSELEFDDTDNALKTQDDTHTQLTARSHPLPGSGNGSGNGTGISSSLPKDNTRGITEIPEVPRWSDAREYTPPTLDEMVDGMTAPLLGASPGLRQPAAGAQPAEPAAAVWDASALVEEIALATPTALAHAWTPMSIHGKSAVTYPVLEAVMLEAREQSITEREASLWLLKRMRTVTEAVQREAGWERYWTPGRLTRFLRGTEYRNMAQFEVVTPREGGSDGNGRGKTAAAGSKAERNGAAVRRALESKPGHGEPAGAVPPPGTRGRAGSVGEHAGSRPDAAGHGHGVRGGAGAPHATGSGHSVREGSGVVPVHATAVRTSRLGWPA